MGAATIPLMGVQAPPPTPIQSGVGIQNSLAVLAGQQQIAAQQAIKTQTDQIALEQQKQYMDDSNTFRAALVANKGDVDKSLQDVLPKVSPLSYQQFYAANTKHKLDMATIDKDTLATHQDQLNRLGDLHDKAVKMSPDEYAQSWPEIAAEGNNIQPGLNLDPNKPIPQAQLEAHGVTQHTAQWYVEQELKNRQAKEAEAKAAETTQKTTDTAKQNLASDLANAGNETDWQNALNFHKSRVPAGVLSEFGEHYSPAAAQRARNIAIGPAEQAKIAAQTPTEKLEMNDWLSKNPGKGPSDFLLWKQQHSPTMLALGNFGGQGDPMVDMVGQNRVDLATALQRVPPGAKDTFLRQLQAKYPEYNQGQFGIEKKVGESFTSGTYSQQLNAINTAREHMNTFKTLATALGNGDVQALNKLKNAWQEQFGSAAPTNFLLARDAFAGEVGKSLAGAGVTQGDRREVEESINRAESPAQLLGAANTADALLAGKQKALRDTFTQGKQGKPNFGEGNQAPTGGLIYARDPQGKLHSAPAGTKLPAGWTQENR